MSRELTKTPIISIIIPVYNGQKTIQETIQSVLNQSFTDWELIIINDGSNDFTLEIVSKIQDTRIKVFTYKNAGLSASRNRGLDKASGEFITFLDADDIWKPEKLEAQFKALQENPYCAVAYSWTDYIDDKSQFLRPGKHLSYNGDVCEQLLLKNFLESGSNPLIRRQALAEVGSFDETLTAAEDWDMWLRLARRYTFVAVPQPHILYRQSMNSMSAQIVRQEAECLKFLERAFHTCPPSLQHLKKRSIANLYEYLAFKAIEGYPTRQQGLCAARCLTRAISSNLSLLRRWQVITILLFKIALAVLIPKEAARVLLMTLKKVYKNSMQALC